MQVALIWGYAGGIALLVPLGDLLRRRPLMVVMALVASLAVLSLAWSPTILGAAIAGMFSPLPQVAVPYAIAVRASSAGTSRGVLSLGRTSFGRVLSGPTSISRVKPGASEAGRIAGLLQGGQLAGLLTSRAWAGLLGEAWGWRPVLIVQAVLLAGTAVLLLRALPGTEPPRTRRGEGRILDIRVVRICVSGALVGVAFGAFWTALPLLVLASGGGPVAVGAFGLVAGISAVVSPFAGRFRPSRVQPVALLVAAIGWLALARHRLIAATVLIDAGIWSNQVANQALLFRAPAAIHGRLNTAYFTTRFTGIAAGSLLASQFWPRVALWPALGVLIAGLLVLPRD